MSNYIRRRLEGIKQIVQTIDAHANLSFILKCQKGAIICFDTVFADPEIISNYKYLTLGAHAILVVGYRGDSRAVLDYLHAAYYNWLATFGQAPSGLILVKGLESALHQRLTKANSMPLAVKTMIYDPVCHKLHQLSVDASYTTHSTLIAGGKSHKVLLNKIQTSSLGLDLSAPLQEVVYALKSQKAIDLSGSTMYTVPKC